MVKYPHLIRAITDIAYDNGVIYRCGEEEHVLVNRVIDLIEERYPPDLIAAVNDLLSELNDQEFEDLTVGETPYPMPAWMRETHELLNFAFEVL